MRVTPLRLLRAVLWSFLGVRRGADAARDIEAVPPHLLILAGVFVAALFVGGIVVLVRVVIVPRAEMTPSAERVQRVPTTVAKRHEHVVVDDTMQERMRPCTVCHGSVTETSADGFSPRVAGKPAGYLFNQLVSFRDGRRTYAPMVYLVQYMTDDYLHEIATYFAQLDLPYPAPTPMPLSPPLASRARQLVERGDAARGVPACTECHGTRLTGIEPAIPSLLALPKDYVAAQLGAWRNGKLRSVAPDCMAEVARRLAPDDVPALASWLASQPVPPNMHAEPARANLPLQCGSVDVAVHPAASVASTRISKASAAVERGGYLVTAGDCIACHTARGGAPFAGGGPIDTPFGTIDASNITPDVATGIGAWSRDDFWRALHDGRSRDGRSLYPAFPYTNFTRVTREDADAMFDYLRTLPPAARANTANAVRFPYDTRLALAVWRALFFRPGVFENAHDRVSEWNRGAYLVRGLAHCDACHSQRNVFGAVGQKLDLGGGLIPMQNWYAPPLVSAVGAGASNWAPADIEALLRTGISPRAMAMGPMAEVVHRSTQHLSPEDTRAIATYLRSFARGSEVKRNSSGSADAATLTRGAAVYEDRCGECHGSNGQGAFPAYPPLAANPSVTEDLPTNAIKAVLNGGYPPVTAENRRPYGMPPYLTRLSASDIAAVLTYVRTSWGNGAPAVTTFEIEKYR
ncbi:MAG TPA: c-type cytochrome [Casimicrobiaceae bacterium]|nr:c-type cytochrome [Casimicrobiaceae bacterium]